MGLISNQISRKKLQPGDHIYTWRIKHLHVYAHHGIYEGEGNVVHFTHGRGPQKGIPVSSTPNYRLCHICEGHSNFKDYKVIRYCLDCFLAGGDLYRYEYNVSKSYFLAKAIGGTCTLAPSDPPKDVLSRANFHLQIGGKNRFGTSGQVNAVAAGSVGLALNACGLTMLGISAYCYVRVKSDVSRMRMKGKVIEFPAENLVSILESGCTSPKEEWLRIAGSKFKGK